MLPVVMPHFKCHFLATSWSLMIVWIGCCVVEISDIVEYGVVVLVVVLLVDVVDAKAIW